MKGSELGWAQLALSSEGLAPAPPSEIRERCANLLELFIQASRYTQEGVATFVVSLDVPEEDLATYRGYHPQDYLDAAGALEWLRKRGVDNETKFAVAFAIGQLALAIPLLDEWRRERLFDIGATRHWLQVGSNRPDRRFPALCRFLSAQPDAVLEQIGSGGVVAAVRTCRGVAVDGQQLSFSGHVEPPLSSEFMLHLAKTIFGDLVLDFSIEAEARLELLKRWRIPALSLPGLAPTLMSVVLTPTTSVKGPFHLYPRIDELHGYPLVHVLYNNTSEPLPGVELLEGGEQWLRPREAALWFVSPDGRGRACHLRPDALREWVEHLDQDTTVSLRDGFSNFGLPTGEPRLSKRRHILLVQNQTPGQILTVLSHVGLEPGVEEVLVAVFQSDWPDVAYVLLRSPSGSPVVVVPTALITARRMIEELHGATGKVRFHFVGSAEMMRSWPTTVDIMRVLSDFEGRDWQQWILPTDLLI
ncbi:hypothetical protein [Arthrobacter oryzae]|uniref:hypothetical protein n=1 Tax=Arthrobacter oryzae TaxID=409290 RepID=UPI00278608B5|nr:hypothetical protein [Arthrobacter oryzae]MDQ0078529.1 hypothetical protein [Arthrobacter oryzae]